MPVTIVAIYRPPVLMNAPTIGEPPKDWGRRQATLPYPPRQLCRRIRRRRRDGGVVLYESVARRSGRRDRHARHGSAGGFESAAREALTSCASGRSYRARPVPATTYVVFGFQSSDRVGFIAASPFLPWSVVVPLNPASDSSPRQLEPRVLGLDRGVRVVGHHVSRDARRHREHSAICDGRPAGISSRASSCALILRMRGIKLPPRDSWGGHALLGLLMIGFGNGCLVWAQQFVPSGVAAVLVSVIPFWMIGVEAFMPDGEPIRKRRCSACCWASAASCC